MRKMFRHTAILLLEVLAGLLAVAIIGGGILAVRLDEDDAPLRLAFLTPYLERGLNEVNPNIKVKVGETVLTWSDWRSPLDLRARNVQVSDATGHSLAILPDIAVSLSVPALFWGEIAPSAIEVVGPRLVVVRTQEGRLRLGFGESEEQPADPLTPDLALALLQPAEEGRPLRRISVRQASVILLDRRADEVWRLPSVDFQLRRSREGARVRLNASLTQLAQPATLRAELAVPANGDPAAANMEVAALDPQTLAALAGIPEIARLRLPVGGVISGLVQRSGEVSEVKFSLGAGQGAIDLPELYPEPLPVAGANLRGRIAQGFDRLELDGAELTVLDGPTLTLSGNATGLATDTIRIEARLASGAASTETVLRYWPVRLGPAARDWIAENISGGMAEDGEVQLVLTMPRARPQEAVVDSAEGYFRASGLTVTYLKGLPALEGVAGEGRLSGTTLTMTIAAAQSGPLVVTSGTVEVTNLDREPETVTIAGRVKGPVRDALELLDRKRLGYPRRIGIDPKTASGSAEAKLWFRLPADKDVKMEDVSIRVEAQLTDAALTDAAFGVPIGDGQLELAVDMKGLDMAGTAAIAGTPTRLTWRENFRRAAFDTRINAELTPGTRARAALGLHTAPWVEGPTPLEILYTRTGDSAKAEITADLTRASMDLEPLAWSKPAGVPGRARATLALRKREVVAFDAVSLEAGDLRLAGKVAIGRAADAPTRIALTRLAWGASSLEDVAVELGSTTEVRIGGGTWDAAPFLDRRKERSRAGQDGEDDKGPAFRILAPRLAELRTGADRSLAPAALDVAHDGERWQWARVSGGMPAGKTMSLSYGLDPATGRRTLNLSSDDAGALLRTARLLETVVGGTLTVEGTAEEPGLAAPLPVRAEIQDYRVVRGKVMAKILQEAKLADINSLLAKEGIPFARFTGRLVLSDDGIRIDKARAYGAALGITGQGRIDLEADRLELEGTIVPAYVVSQVIGEIPLIGRILTGGEGEGLFAATYRADGPLDDPRVSVNPLAALAPGFLRGLFNIFDGGGEEGEAEYTPLPPRDPK
jgi:uncharacterized protein YhdP